MFNPLKWLFRKATTKNTTQLQFESVRVFMRHLGYDSYQDGRFYRANGQPHVKGCEVVSYRTAVRLHNERVWVYIDTFWVAPKFNPKMHVRLTSHHIANRNRVLHKCKQQLVEKHGEHSIKTQSHVVHFADRGYAKATGLI